MHQLIHDRQLAGHRAVVVGAGISGLAAAKLLTALGAEVRILEKDSAKADALALEAGPLGWDLRLGEHTPDQFAGVDLVIVSPGVAMDSIAPYLPSAAKVVSELELGSWFVSKPVVAVTGTNGKTTTTAMIAHILTMEGHRVFAGGNLGEPLCAHVLSGREVDFVVLEVSSFQAQFTESLHPASAVLLNFSANHLDHHRSMDEYLNAKLRLFARMTDQDQAVLALELKELLEPKNFTRARRVYFVANPEMVCPRLRGNHNLANAEAAYLALRPFGVTREKVRRALATFVPWPHRLQSVVEHRGVLWVDDSKATTVDALRAALRSFPGRPILLLAGGVFKGGDLTSLLPLLRDTVREIFLFGASREIFESAWQGHLPLTWSPSLDQAVALAHGRAVAGDVVLLSPATASFDLFANYKERGLAFQRALVSLTAGREVTR
ncbi:MAG: UDP-N-acetylmuramoyl-L-alanine--D-glutamate ligase [Deltaproteobacteria bacterium]|nr:UDP-N-acetylmuramoyl-L-alanine--D-glutamate ligase [Deltaproteobacteria bacterium]